MKLVVGCVICYLIFGLVRAAQFNNINVDSASRQLLDFRKEHKLPIGVLTTNAGKPLDIRETTSINSELLTNKFFIDDIKQLTNERTPERVVLAKGTGAFGYFEVTNDVSKYTKAKVFNGIGKKTPLFARFAIAQVDKGGSDTDTLALRGFSIKMYTEEGNLDFLNIQIPVFNIRDPLYFAPSIHSLQRNPVTNIRDLTSAIDFIFLQPSALHAVLYIASGLGLPRGYRRMNAYPIHTYEIYNQQGESYFVRFKFLTELGYGDGLTLEEASQLGGSDPDFFERDLYNAIELKKFPSWKVKMDVMTAQQIKEVDFDPFDVTRLWRNGTYKTVTLGRVVLNENVENQFASVEQSAFSPANLVPGILGPHDQIFKGRVLAYSDAHINRLGINANKVAVNCPRYAKTYNRDGLPPVQDNGRNSPAYFPNSFNGPLPYVDESKPNRRVTPLLQYSFDLEPSANFYNNVLITETQKNRLTDNLGQGSIRLPREIVERFAKLLRKVDKDLARRYLKAVERAKRTMMLPETVDDLPSVMSTPKPN